MKLPVIENLAEEFSPRDRRTEEGDRTAEELEELGA
jgi:hypothetical protein